MPRVLREDAAAGMTRLADTKRLAAQQRLVEEVDPALLVLRWMAAERAHMPDARHDPQLHARADLLSEAAVELDLERQITSREKQVARRCCLPHLLEKRGRRAPPGERPNCRVHHAGVEALG